MREVIENMMSAFGITEERLKIEKEVALPIGETLYWDYYSYVKRNSVTKWEIETCILCGGKNMKFVI